MQIFSDLISKNLIQDISDEQLDDRLSTGDSFYAGFDPTAPSLHLGNFVLIMTMLRLAQAGLKPIMLFGGATGQVGDPSGKSSERPMLSISDIEENVRTQMSQAEAIFTRLGYNIDFVNNADWTNNVSITKFLREVGKYITVNYMIAKDTVKARLEDGGISFTEFTYMLIQANDFLHLYQEKNCKLQIGGSDQWGNLTCGLELIRKKLLTEEDHAAGNKAYAFSIPLLTKSDGKKFGKSEQGAIWLDPQQTTPYQLHQFLLNTADSDVIDLIQKLTFADDQKIAELKQELQDNPGQRTAHKFLADELCTIIHGADATEEAQKAGKILFGGSPEGLPAKMLLNIFAEVPSTEQKQNQINEMDVTELFHSAGACKSKGEARRLISNGGAYINNRKVEEADYQITDKDLIDDQLTILRTGKKNYFLIRWV